MPVDAFMTGRRCALFVVVVIGVCCWVASSFLADLRQLDDNLSGWPAGSGSDHAIADRQSRDKGPNPSDCLEHLSWFVQISDIHISIFYDKHRVSDLKSFCQNTLKLISPEVVLVTGDITDAKLEDREGSRQFEDEWKQYDRVLQETGITKDVVWLDTRGNHDTFNVPSLTSSENYFGVYSAQGKHGKLSYHYLHHTKYDDVISFIAVDACPNPGPKRPFNFFGVLSEVEMKRLEQFVEASRDATQTIFFGHYPTSTIGGSVSNIRHLMGNGSMYLCGHLHTLGGLIPHMYVRQQSGFLELELADWKDQRVYRIVSIDHGLVSFVDVPLDSWPVVLITNPKNSQFLVDGHEPTWRIKRSTHIRVLIFSPSDITAVTVKINGVDVGMAKHVQGPLYVLPWQPLHYDIGQHTIQVHVMTKSGEESTVLQPFSISGSRPPFDFYQRFVLMSDHAAILKTTFAACFILAVLPLLVMRVVHIHFHMTAESRLSGCFLRILQCWMRRLCLLVSTPSIFYPLLFYNVYIAIGPWFVGEIIADHIGACFLFGFFVNGMYIPLVLTYLYGSLQILLFNVPLTLYLGRCLDLTRIRCHRDCTVPRLPGRLWPLVWLLDHSFFLVLIGFQAYLVLSGFYRSYGGLSLVLCPLRTWAILLAIFLRRQALVGCNAAKAAQFYSAATATTPGLGASTMNNGLSSILRTT